MNGGIEKIRAGQQEIDRLVQAQADLKRVPAAQNGAAENRFQYFAPVFDGAFDPEKYTKCPVKILFVAQEPGFPGDAGWDSGGGLSGDDLYGVLDTVAGGILNGAVPAPENPAPSGQGLTGNAPLQNTALVYVSNVPRTAHTGLEGNLTRLYNGNRELFEKKLRLYDPRVTVCHNTAGVIWDALRDGLCIDDYKLTYYDSAGKEIPLGGNNEPVETPAAAVYYGANGKIIIDAYGSIYRYPEAWAAGVINAYRAMPVPCPVPGPAVNVQREDPSPPAPALSAPAKETPGEEASKPRPLVEAAGGTVAAAKEKPRSKLPLKPVLAALLLLFLLLLLLLRRCGSPGGADVPAVTPAAEPAAAARAVPAAPLPPVPVFSEMTEAIFIKDSAVLLPSASDWLNQVAEELARSIGQNGAASFRITGYTAVFPGPPDPVGLSLERAETIVRELASRGIALDKLEAVGGGETDKWGSNADEESRKPNRRIVIVRK